MTDLNSIRFGTLALFLLAGCSSDPAGVSPFDLAVARDKWNRSGIESYQIEFRFQGQLNYPTGFTRLEVLQEHVVSAQSLDGLITYPPPFDPWPTVSQLFDLIEANTQHHPRSGMIAVDATVRRGPWLSPADNDYVPCSQPRTAERLINSETSTLS